jgi:DNA-binding response OmpR family regulator
LNERPTRDAGAILLVEDDCHIRALEAQALRDGGCEVIEAGDADEALAWLAKGRISLLVTDIRLPGALDGIGLAARMRQHLPQLKILMVGMDADQLPAGRRGMLADRTLRKPFSVAELERCVAELIAPAPARKS